MTSVEAVPVAVTMLAAVTLGPLVLNIAGRTMEGPIALRRLEATGVVTATGLVVASVSARPPEDVAVLIPLAVLGCAAAVVDAREGRLPDHLTGPLLGATLAVGLLTGPPAAVLLPAMIAAGAGLIAKSVATAAVGWGDVKLAPSIAVVLVHQEVVARGVVTISLLLIGTVLITSLRSGPATLVPYGPAMVFGTVAAAAF